MVRATRAAVNRRSLDPEATDRHTHGILSAAAHGPFDVRRDSAVTPASILSGAPAEGLLPTSLRCEYLTDPLGIDAPAPRLPWQLGAAAHWRRAALAQEPTGPLQPAGGDAGAAAGSRDDPRSRAAGVVGPRFLPGAGTTSARLGGDCVTFEVGSGEYRFQRE